MFFKTHLCCFLSRCRHPSLPLPGQSFDHIVFLRSFLLPLVSSNVIQLPIANDIMSSSKNRTLSEFFNYPRHSVLAITFSTPNGPFFEYPSLRIFQHYTGHIQNIFRIPYRLCDYLHHHKLRRYRGVMPSKTIRLPSFMN